jgi:hypothetical protein
VHPFVSVAVIVKRNVPGVVGVPVRTPATRSTPSGSAPDVTEKVYGVSGLPDAASGWL